jgi:hypothetical protein
MHMPDGRTHNKLDAATDHIIAKKKEITFFARLL